MIIHDFNIKSVAVFPSKADSPLVIDPDTVLALPMSSQGLEPIAGRLAKILEAGRSVEVE
jgi:hypothetical protein